MTPTVLSRRHRLLYLLRKAELTRCVTALRTIYPPISPRKAGGAAGKARAVKRETSDDHPELTHRRSGSGGLISNAVVDLEWLDSLAEEFNVVCEGWSCDGEGGAGEGAGEGGDGDGGRGRGRGSIGEQCNL